MKFLYNTKTNKLHIEGYCQYAKKNASYLPFDTEDEALAYGGRALGMCKTCQRKREAEEQKRKP
ncbi:MAG: hypothetical protein HFE45_09190 [Oscillospiraceae bacterium]|jgi:hypothetical protein|nr:hypothetical protein [Oscillospiraceae bacterium]